MATDKPRTKGHKQHARLVNCNPFS